MQAVVDSNSPPWAIHRSEVVGRGRLSHAESVILVVMMTVVFDLVLHGPPAISRTRLERTDRLWRCRSAWSGRHAAQIEGRALAWEACLR